MKHTRTLAVVGYIGWAIIILLAFIGVAGATAHLLDATTHVGDTPSFHQTTLTLYGPDFTPHWYGFRIQPLARALHMAPGLFWMAFVPLQFAGSVRRRWPALHRWSGRLAVASTVFLVPSGIIFAALRPLANAFVELVPIAFYAAIYVISLGMGVWRARQKNFASHREWMIRAFSVGIGISSVRLWYVLFLNTTGMHAQDFFATAFWIAFGVNLVIAEIWINVTRDSALRLAPVRTDAARSQPQRTVEPAPLVMNAREAQP